MTIIKHYKIDLEGKKVVGVGQSPARIRLYPAASDP